MSADHSCITHLRWERVTPLKTRAVYTVTDSVTGVSYTSEESTADSRTWTLTGLRDGTVQLHSRHHSFTDASYKAVAHANSVREELTRRTVTDYRHPQFDARLQVVTNGATRMTEVVLNDEDSTTRLVLDLNEVAALHEALGKVVHAQQEARAALTPA